MSIAQGPGRSRESAVPAKPFEEAESQCSTSKPAADPDTIRELLAERDELRAEVEQLRSELADAREEADDGALIVMHITQDEALHDEFLAWYKPDEWLNSRRAACSFVAMKLGKAGERP